MRWWPLEHFKEKWGRRKTTLTSYLDLNSTRIYYYQWNYSPKIHRWHACRIKPYEKMKLFNLRHSCINVFDLHYLLIKWIISSYSTTPPELSPSTTGTSIGSRSNSLTSTNPINGRKWANSTMTFPMMKHSDGPSSTSSKLSTKRHSSLKMFSLFVRMNNFWLKICQNSSRPETWIFHMSSLI